MKKSILIVVLLAAVVLLTAEAHDNSEYQKFQEYSENPNPQTFESAYKFYSSKDDNTSMMLQAYLHWEELNRVLDEFAANKDSLDMRSKFSYANLLLEIGRYEDAVKIYDELNEASPQWACPWRHKGEALWNMKNYSESEAALQKSIDVRKNHYDAYVMLAEVQSEQGKYEEALKTLEEGFKYRDENPEYSEDTEFEANVNKLHKELLEKTGRK